MTCHKSDSCYRYSLMLECWNLSADLRPSFTNIVSSLQKMLQSSQDYLDIDQSESVFTCDGSQSESVFAANNQSETTFMSGSLSETRSVFHPNVQPQQESFQDLHLDPSYPDCPLVYQEDQYLEPLTGIDYFNQFSTKILYISMTYYLMLN